MKKSMLFLPFIGLVAFTLVGIFLAITPATVSLSPGSNIVGISIAEIFAITFSVVTLAVLLISLFRNKK